MIAYSIVALLTIVTAITLHTLLASSGKSIGT